MLIIQRLRPYVLPAVYLAAGYQFLRYYVSIPFFYLRLPDYFGGQERLPFQYRVFPIPFLKLLGGLHIIRHVAAGRAGPLHNPDRIAFLLLSALAFSVVVYFTLRLYRAVTLTRHLDFLVYPVLLFILLWTYVIHIEQDFSYPYDMPSLAFFTAGIYFIYQRRFAPLPFIILFGTFNRETTLFLIALYIIDAASVSTPLIPSSLRERFNFAQVPWLRVALLTALWLAVKVTLFYLFRWNARQEDYNRVHENLIRLISPNYWPVFLNIFGYLLPFVLLFRNRIGNRRLGNYLYLLVPWFAIMFYAGIIVETRVYGEFSAYIAVVSVLILEQYTSERRMTHQPPAPESSATPVALELPAYSFHELTR